MRTMWNELGVSILKNCPKLRKVDENPCKVKHNSEYKKKISHDDDGDFDEAEDDDGAGAKWRERSEHDSNS